MNSWIFLTLLSSFLVSIANVVNKQVNNNLNEYSVGWSRNFFSLPVFWIALSLVGIPAVDPKFWPLLAITAPLELLVVIFFFKALKASPLSIVMPIGSFGALFIAIGAFFILGERITFIHSIAFALLVLGSYLLNVKLGKSKDLLYPIKQLKREKGAFYMLITCLLFGVNIPLGKLMIDYSSPQFYTAIYFSLNVLLFTPLFLKKGTQRFKGIANNFKSVILMGVLNGLFLLTLWQAFSMGPSTMVNAFSRVSVLITVLLAGAFLKEEELLKRLIAGLVMTAGAILVILNP